MARLMAEGDVTLFRAVRVITYAHPTDPEDPERQTFQEVFGPYRTIGAAKAAITREENGTSSWYRRYYDDVTVTTRIEKATMTWEPVQ